MLKVFLTNRDTRVSCFKMYHFVSLVFEDHVECDLTISLPESKAPGQLLG